MRRLPLNALLLLLISSLVFSCQEDEMPPIDPTCVTQTYVPSLYISNEGPFSNGSGTISVFNTSTNTVIQNGFTDNNCDEALGSIVQSISTHNEKAYIIVNNANKMIVADINTLEKVVEVTDLVLPRYFLPVGNDKAFISQWGVGGTEGSIAVFDLNTNEVTKTIPCGTGPENMILIGDQVYVANNGGFGRDSTVAIINVATESLDKTLVVADNPHSFVIDNDNRLWCLSSGFSDFYDPSALKPGNLAHLKDGEVDQSIELPQGVKWLNINNAGNELYYLGPGGIFKQSISVVTPPTDPFVSGNFYTLGVDFNTDNIYASDAADFSSAGKVYQYDTDGKETLSFDAGIIPGGLWFQ